MQKRTICKYNCSLIVLSQNCNNSLKQFRNYILYDLFYSKCYQIQPQNSNGLDQKVTSCNGNADKQKETEQNIKQRKLLCLQLYQNQSIRSFSNSFIIIKIRLCPRVIICRRTVGPRSARATPGRSRRTICATGLRGAVTSKRTST